MVNQVADNMETGISVPSRRTVFKLLLMSLTIVASTGAWSATQKVGSYTWRYEIIDGTAEICRDWGNDLPAVSPMPNGSIEIPSRLGGKPVTSIGDSAFWSCDRLTSVTIPSSVTHIGCGSFSVCSSLTRVTIPSSVTYIGASSFAECSSLTGVTIPNSVTSIDCDAFGGCSLNSVTVPASVRYIGQGAFDCETLKSLVLPVWCKNARESFETGYIGIAPTGTNLRGGGIIWYLACCGCKYLGGDTQEESNAICEAAFTRHVKITFKDVWDSGTSGGGGVADVWKKARMLQGALVDNNTGLTKGVIQVKVGKASRKGEVAISGTIIGLDGKKQTARGGKVTVRDSSATVTLSVRGGSLATVTVAEHGISGSWNGNRIVQANIGGEYWKTARFSITDGPEAIRDANSVSYPIWPENEPVEMRGRKWYCEKAGRMKWLMPCCYYEGSRSGCVTCSDCCGWGGVGDSNYSGLRLNYNLKTGTFKGSFTLYQYVKDFRQKKEKGVKKKVNVSGILIDGVGYGTATARGVGSWMVSVK